MNKEIVFDQLVMRVLLLYPELALERKAGVQKKFWGQFNAFRNNGFLVNAIFCQNQEICTIDGKSESVIRHNHPKNWLLFTFKYFLIAHKELRKIKYDFIYIRYPFSQPIFFWFLFKAKKYHLKVFLEFATFPYDQEFKDRSLLKKSVLWIDKFFRMLLKNFVDQVFTYTEHKTIYGIEAIKIENGIDSLSIRKKHPNSNPNQLNLIGVANLKTWDGYDRIIAGISEYYRLKKPQEIDIHFSIIGVGPAKISLEKLVISLNLKEIVVFKGQLEGNELDTELDNAHIGIGCLALHRIGLTDGSTIKLREYCAAGLPFIFAYNDKDFGNDFKYAMKISADDHPVNIFHLIEFYQTIKDHDYTAYMNEYAKSKLSWEIKLQPVFKCMKEMQG